MHAAQLNINIDIDILAQKVADRIIASQKNAQPAVQVVQGAPTNTPAVAATVATQRVAPRRGEVTRKMRAAFPREKDLSQYFRVPGTPMPSRGRPRALTTAGEKKAWDLYQGGFNFVQISDWFGGRASEKTVRKSIRAFEAYLKENS